MIATYQLVHAATTSGPGACSLSVIQNGRIRGFYFTAIGTGGAGIGRYSNSLELNNTGQTNAETNNPNRYICLGRFGHSTPNATGFMQAGPFVPLDTPVRAGDILSLNQLVAGTAVAAQVVSCSILVEE